MWLRHGTLECLECGQLFLYGSAANDRERREEDSKKTLNFLGAVALPRRKRVDHTCGRGVASASKHNDPAGSHGVAARLRDKWHKSDVDRLMLTALGHTLEHSARGTVQPWYAPTALSPAPDRDDRLVAVFDHPDVAKENGRALAALRALYLAGVTVGVRDHAALRQKAFDARLSDAAIYERPADPPCPGYSLTFGNTVRDGSSAAKTSAMSRKARRRAAEARSSTS